MSKILMHHRERKTRRSQVDIDFRQRKPRQQTNHSNRDEKEQQPVVNKLPELRRGKGSITSGNSKLETVN